jgi:hypothetical protein
LQSNSERKDEILIEIVLVFLLLGSIGGFLSGMLGVGGAIIMIPLMLYVPQLFGLEALGMKTVAALSMVQVLFASLSGLIRHRINRLVDLPLMLYLGIPFALAANIGAVLSKYATGTLLLVIFGMMTIFAFVMMMFPIKKEEIDKRAAFSKPIAVMIGLIIGFLAGMVGAGGGFIIIPLMIYILKMPVKLTIGTSLGVIFIGSLMGALGKIFTGQVVWLPALALIISSIPSAQIGASLSGKTADKKLRILLILIILASALRVWYDILF